MIRRRNILAHRGYWKHIEDKNSLNAILMSLDKGYGIETDVRDMHGELVISHDPPSGKFSDYITLEHILDKYSEAGWHGTLALNVKADGLADRINDLLKVHDISSYFVFDMSVPDTLLYLNSDIMVYSRVSEYEVFQDFDGRAGGIWIDCFTSSFNPLKLFIGLQNRTANAAFVSPELHGRDHEPFWRLMKEEIGNTSCEIMLCTDFPDQAAHYFGLSNDD